MIVGLVSVLALGADTQLAYDLYLDEDWQELALEARRLVEAGDSSAQLLLAAAYARTGRWERAQALIRNHHEGSADLLGAWLWQEHEPEVAAVLLERVRQERLSEEQRSWRNDTLIRLNVELGRYPTAADLAIEAGYASIPDGSGLPHRSPGLGAVLSAAVPGLGQAVSGNHVGALSALLLNGGLAAGLGYAIAHEQWGSASLVGFFAFGFYLGNVYGGADAAIQFNRRQRDRLVRELDAAGAGSGPPPLVLTEQPAGA